MCIGGLTSTFVKPIARNARWSSLFSRVPFPSWSNWANALAMSGRIGPMVGACEGGGALAAADAPQPLDEETNKTSRKMKGGYGLNRS